MFWEKCNAVKHTTCDQCMLTNNYETLETMYRSIEFQWVIAIVFGHYLYSKKRQFQVDVYIKSPLLCYE
ncbi:hypothetical protein BLOT_014688 [Blomia tropicalis]|nr:hypothetical protein BLOT_014688 [Blomia tropicalis]